MGKAIAQRLVKLGAEAQFVSGNDIDLEATYIKVMTLHSAKGLEFPFVAVVGLREGTPYTSTYWLRYTRGGKKVCFGRTASPILCGMFTSHASTAGQRFALQSFILFIRSL